eukprot:CAMPEP_0178939690 /NCGR_PEP_ID=MMETSP0789-20121207/362_1 /TAXON_ID=3005 /ORGANISM="Rhizosolenia setigera, Strain CCMP 1694" /LENGTH=224 /DNA_ID=CAMNT_0020618583 /DNA_START=73 /DNA_END=747 /DNA_ORIENTATION=-
MNNMDVPSDSVDSITPYIPDSKKRKLSQAYKALAEVSELIDAETNPLSEKKFDEKIDTVNKSVSDLCNQIKKHNGHLDSNNCENRKAIHEICKEIKKSNKLTQRNNELAEKNNKIMEKQARLKRLELASSRTSLGSFQYRPSWSSQVELSSSTFVKGVIDWFLFDLGTVLPKDAYIGAFQCKTKDYEEGKAKFREKVMEQVQLLIGHRPRMFDNGNDTYSIFYE